MIRFPMNQQFFAADTGGGTGDGNQNQNAGNGDGNPQNTGSNQNSSSQTIDYDKIQSMINKGAQQKENAILKSYFQQMGMTEEEARTAMETFKANKQAQQTQQPDVSAIQAQLLQAQQEAQRAEIEKQATLEAISLGLDAKTIPYALKMADFSTVVGTDGKVNQETLKKALGKVLEDVPQLKPTPAQASGFQVGGSGGGQQTTGMDDALKAAFGL